MTWSDRAACLDDRHFTEKPFAEQKPVCLGCPVRLECLDDFLATATRVAARELSTRGGMSPDELSALLQDRPRPATYLRTCTMCQTPFGSRTLDARYCSKGCRQKAYEMRHGLPAKAWA